MEEISSQRIAAMVDHWGLNLLGQESDVTFSGTDDPGYRKNKTKAV